MVLSRVILSIQVIITLYGEFFNYKIEPPKLREKVEENGGGGVVKMVKQNGSKLERERKAEKRRKVKAELTNG